MGYTPLYTAGAWVGFDDKRIFFTSSDGQGGRAAAPIWGRFMKYSYEALKPKITYFNTNWNGAVNPGDTTHGVSDTNRMKTINPAIPQLTPQQPFHPIVNPSPK